MTAQIEAACAFATAAHNGQTRRFGQDEPYIEHPKRVAARVQSIGLSAEAVIAALLHDVVEDTLVTIDQIHQAFGSKVRRYVWIMTDEPTIEGGPNRAARKEITRMKFFMLQGLDCIELSCIKGADCLDNAHGIKKHDPNFWKVFKREVTELIKVMPLMEPTLRGELCDVLEYPRWVTDGDGKIWCNGKLK